MPGGGHGLDLDEKVPRRLRSEGNARDVFCMVKGYMSDDHLSQPPLLVYAHSFLPATQAFVNKINSTELVLRPSLEEGRCEELLELAKHIEQDFPHLQHGAAYLRSLTNADRPHVPYPRLRFIESGPVAFNNHLAGLQLGQRPPDPKPYKLRVVFHHLPRG